MNWINFLLVILGAIAFLVYKYSKAIELPEFKLNKFLKRNLPAMILNIIMGLSVIIAGWIDTVQINETEIGKMWWFGVGAGGQFLFRKIFKTFEKKYKDE